LISIRLKHTSLTETEKSQKRKEKTKAKNFNTFINEYKVQYTFQKGTLFTCFFEFLQFTNFSSRHFFWFFFPPKKGVILMKRAATTTVAKKGVKKQQKLPDPILSLEVGPYLSGKSS
jgi:hypothetical protein